MASVPILVGIMCYCTVISTCASALRYNHKLSIHFIPASLFWCDITSSVVCALHAIQMCTPELLLPCDERLMLTGYEPTLFSIDW